MTDNGIDSTRCLPRGLLKAGYYAALLFCASVYLGSSLWGQEERGPAAPDGDGKELFTMVCSQCHTLKSTLIMRDGQKGWEEMVNRMVLYGAQLSPAEADRVTRYLTTQLGPSTAAIPNNTSSSHNAGRSLTRTITLPEGRGKELVAARCSLCHNLEKVVSAKRSRSDWEATTINMKQRGMQATPDEMQTMISYLQANFSTPTSAEPQTPEQSAHNRQLPSCRSVSNVTPCPSSGHR
jgi:mono/diheme cytochrome c family protein